MIHVEVPTPSLTYWKLFRTLYSTEFVWLLSGDDNRAEDGLELREEFLLESNIPDDPQWRDICRAPASFSSTMRAPTLSDAISVQAATSSSMVRASGAILGYGGRNRHEPLRKSAKSFDRRSQLRQEEKYERGGREVGRFIEKPV